MDVEAELPSYLAKQQVPPVASEIFDRDNQLIGTVFFNERYYVKLSNISQEMRNAVVASEDERFYLHRGFDIRGIVRAFVSNFIGKSSNDKKSGGSTITQQVARSDLFMGMSEQTVERKIKEIVLAYYLEKKYSKDEILEFYLNEVYFGYPNYGVEAAARNYFGKHAKDLNYSEAAMLAGLLPAPDDYKPTADMKMALFQQRVTLVKLAKNKFISEADINKYNVEPKMKVLDNTDYRVRSLNYFTDYIIKIMKQKYTEKELAEGGFKIHTTIYKGYQMNAAESIKSVFDAAIKKKEFSNKVMDEHGVYQPQCCTVSMDPKTGYILAMVGGRDYNNTQFNRTDRPNIRHPGSSFKVYDYTTAFETMSDTGGSLLTSDDFGVNGWYPGEWSGDVHGNYLVRNALEQSSNVCALKTAMRAGLARVAYFAAKMGLKTDIPDYPSITIGSIDVTALDMCTGYNTVAGKGMRHDPVAILSIKNKDGYEIWKYKDRGFRAVSEQAAFMMTSIFRTVINLRRSDYSRSFGDNIAAKSGTSTDFLSGWYATFTPEITVVSYVGKDSRNIKNSIFSTLWGSAYASPINAGYLNRCLEDKTHPLKVVPFSGPPKDVYSYPVCRTTGMRATEYCPKEPTKEHPNQGVVWEWFRKGTEPTHPCTIHFENEKEYMVVVEMIGGKEVYYKPDGQDCETLLRKIPEVDYEKLPTKKCLPKYLCDWFDAGTPIQLSADGKPILTVDKEVTLRITLEPELIANIDEVEFYFDDRRIKVWQSGAKDTDDPNLIVDLIKPIETSFKVTGEPGKTVKMELIFRGPKNFYSKRDLTAELTP